MKYHNVTVDTLINDPSFRRWVLSSASADAARWQRWMEVHPAYHTQVQEAKELLLALRPKDRQASTQAEARIWAGIRKQIAEEEAAPGKLHRPTKFPGWKVAASVAIGVAGTALLYLWWVASSYVTVSTAYGEVQELLLLDSSWVVLNANSSLRYRRHWAQDADREVWLEGEAFFKVKKRLSNPSSQKYIKFTVHTDPLEVEVLGTEFSVNHRHQETQVVLSEGKVRVVDTAAEQDILLQPGEMLSYTNQTMCLTHVDANTKTSWKEALVILNNESLAHIFARLEDTYGYQVSVADEEILERRFSGSYPRDSVHLLLEKLEKLYQLTITENEKKIKVRK